ncbi:hypothetical protein AJ78_01054 [Emergomyces pasteurianus Ep9510]|uniref:Uncharacterized protein n=1 Tax=Emergomyces pasteurianus Ep9510 TaxID=1447872 RepID=A0A1J9PRU3_9EURO|nr:hypothetical protein AJ78_01054 [Emergomyces pasteurianus Ep9510]
MLKPDLIATSMVNLIQRAECTSGTVYLETEEASNVVFKGVENDPEDIGAVEALPGASATVN